ncbi:hypothetical protein [Fundidesulfovibrio terrae]|uniref:hypothetical protein n=1 Tax=Fundidesulfovibrio terrae TaxID=2922866 RepID=UPI001FAFCE06|nr:hypothetical protein [Fundidesulfovibrio terrae]
MSRRVRSVRVPAELDELDLTGVIAECAKYLRDLESATLLKAQGNREAAEALLKARQADLGKRVGMKVWEARVKYGEKLRKDVPGEAHEGEA